MGIFEDVSKFMLYPIRILKGHMIINEDKLPLHRQKYSHFHLDMLEFVFFPSFHLLTLEKGKQKLRIVLARAHAVRMC